MADAVPEQLVNVIDPDTQELGSIPISQLEQAKAQNFIEATPEQTHQFFTEQKYGTTGQTIKGLAEAAGRGAIPLGGSTAAEVGLGLAKPEDIQGREEALGALAPVGEAAGFVGSVLIPGGQLKALGKAGEAVNLVTKLGRATEEASAAAKAAALAAGATEQAATKAAETAAKAAGKNFGILQHMGSGALKGATENMLYQAGDEVSRGIIGQPQDSDHLVTDIGLSGLIGGVTGGAFGAVNPLWNATFGKKVSAAMNDAANEAAGTIARPSAASAEASAIESMFGDLVQGAKPNSEEITSAASRLGVKPTSGTISSSEFIQNLENNTSKQGTFAGQKLAKETEELFHGLNKEAASTLKEATTETQAQIGKTIKDGLFEKLNSELKPIQAGYSELKPVFKEIPLAPELKNEAANSLMSHELVTLDPEGLNARTANDISRAIKQLKNIDEIKSYRTILNNKISAAIDRIGGQHAENLPVLMKAKELLTGLREAAIESAEKAGTVASESAQKIHNLDAQYRALKDRLTGLGVEAGLGGLGSPKGLAERFKKVADEQVVNKIFDLKDINTLKFMKQNFPKEFEAARKYKLAEIARGSLNEAQGKNGRFEVGRFLRQVGEDKVSPEARELLMPGHGQKIQDIRTLFRAIPGLANPSGTAHAMHMHSLFTLTGLANEASDAMKYALLKSVPKVQKSMNESNQKAVALGLGKALESGAPIDAEALKSSVDYFSRAMKAAKLISNATKAVFDSAVKVIPAHLIPDDKSREKLDKKLKGLQVNQEQMLGVGGKIAHYLPEHGGALAQTAMKSVNYLNSLRPENPQMAPLDRRAPPSPGQMANFNRALDIAEQPLLVMEHLKQGTLVSQDLIHLQNMYPALAQKFTQQLTEQLISKKDSNDVIPYKVIRGLSLFMGQALDSTLSPGAIQAAQPKPVQSGQQPGGQEQHPKHSMTALNKLPGQFQTPDQSRIARDNRA